MKKIICCLIKLLNSIYSATFYLFAPWVGVGVLTPLTVSSFIRGSLDLSTKLFFMVNSHFNKYAKLRFTRTFSFFSKKLFLVRQKRELSTVFYLPKKSIFALNYLSVRCFSRDADDETSKENLFKGKSLRGKLLYYAGYYWEARQIRRRHKKSLFTKFREFLRGLGYQENPSYRFFAGRPSKKENANIDAMIRRESVQFYWGMVDEMKDLRADGLIAPTGDLIACTSEAIRNVEGAMEDEKRRHLLMYRKHLRQEGYSEEKIKEMTTATMPDGQSYVLSDTETVSRRLTPHQIQERDKLRYILSVYEEQETLIAVHIRHIALQEDENFDPINFPPIPVWRYNPAIGNNGYASGEAIENEFLTRYLELEESRARRENQAVACGGGYWGSLVFFNYILQGINTTYGPGAEADGDGFMLNNFLHPIEDHLTHFDGIIPTPHRVWGFFGEGRWGIPYYKHFLWPEPYYHEMGDTQIPEGLHPLDGVLYTPLANKNGTGIIVHDYSMLYPPAPIAGDEGLFTYDAGSFVFDPHDCGSGGLAETIGSTNSYGPWFDDFSQLDFDPGADQYYPVVKVLQPKIAALYELYLQGYQQSWYRKLVLFFARSVHMGMWERPSVDHLFWLDHLLIVFFWGPITVYFTGSNARAWVVDGEVFKLYFRMMWKLIKGRGVGHDDPVIMEMYTWDEGYFRENVRYRVLYMHTNGGFDMYRPLFPDMLLNDSIYPTDYENNPDFNGAEVGVFIQMLGVHFDDYERILVEVYAEQGAVHQKGFEKFSEENAHIIASVKKKEEEEEKDAAMIAAMMAENKYATFNFLAERRYARFRASLTFLPREINLAENLAVEPGGLEFKALVARYTVHPTWITFVDRH